MTMLAAFIGGWEILLILFVLGVTVTVPLIVLAIVFFVLKQQKGNSTPPIPAEQRMSH